MRHGHGDLGVLAWGPAQEVPDQVGHGLLEHGPVPLDEERVALVREVHRHELLGCLVGEGEEARGGGAGRHLGHAHLDQTLFDGRPHVDDVALVVAFVDEGGQLVEELHEATHVPPHHRGEVLAEAHVVVALAQQLHEGVDGDEGVLDLVGDAGHDPGEELELLGGAPLLGELTLCRHVLEDHHRAHGGRALAHHGVRRHLEGQAAQGELDLAAGDGAAARERFVEEIAEGRGQDAEIAVERVLGGHAQDLLGPPVHHDHALLGADGDDPARHALQDALGEFLLVLELVMNTDVADGRGERAGEVEERLDIAPVVRAARDPLAEEQDSHELAMGGEGNGDHGL